MKTKEATRVHIRWMIRCDMPGVLAIERAGFADPWTEEEILAFLRTSNCIGMVAELEEKIIGFFIYELHKTRLHVLNMAVHPAHRREGVGKQLVDKLMSKLAHDRRTRLTAIVGERNLDAQLFFRSLGFRAVRVLRDHYGSEDGYLFAYRLAQIDTDRAKCA